MKWIDLPGLVFLAVILIPNLVFALRCREGFENLWHNRVVELLEQVGRAGCFVFMVLRVPVFCLGYSSGAAFTADLAVDSLLAAAYCLVWIVCFRKNSLFRALALSILPCALFLFSALMDRSLPLLISVLLFAPSHITISVKNAVRQGAK